MAFYPPPNLSLSLTIRNQYQPNDITTAQFALGTVVPPQVTSTARKPLSIAFEEIDADKIEGVGGATGKPIPESMLPASDEEAELADGEDAPVDGSDPTG